jgi:hypothetical protein
MLQFFFLKGTQLFSVFFKEGFSRKTGESWVVDSPTRYYSPAQASRLIIDQRWSWRVWVRCHQKPRCNLPVFIFSCIDCRAARAGTEETHAKQAANLSPQAHKPVTTHKNEPWRISTRLPHSHHYRIYTGNQKARGSQAINNKTPATNLRPLLTNAIGKEWADVNYKHKRIAKPCIVAHKRTLTRCAAPCRGRQPFTTLRVLQRRWTAASCSWREVLAPECLWCSCYAGWQSARNKGNG